MTVLRAQHGLLQLLGSAEDFVLGGSEIDETLVRHCVKEFQRKHKMDPTESPKSLAKIRAGCESAKIQLSQGTNTKIWIESAHEGMDLNCAVSRGLRPSLTCHAVIGLQQV